MGKHRAADDAAADPIVEAAQQNRDGQAPEGAHRADLPGRRGPVGWPGEMPDEGSAPIGWPGELSDPPAGRA
jgi:hypothetical protein